MTNLPEFKSFSKIPRFEGLQVIITQKIHGTNAQVYIEKVEGFRYCSYRCNTTLCECNYRVYAGSRTRWLTPEDDNYGFAKWVKENAQILIQLLGEGRHYGEWAGPGINSGEGLKQKTFVLFEPWRYPQEICKLLEPKLPDGIKYVPILENTKAAKSSLPMLIECAMFNLKEYGSKLVPGYPFPEGIVITINGQRFKKTFSQEDVAWKPKKERVIREHVDYSYLCQPLRLEKLLSCDEKYVREYPKSLPDIVKAYIQDLEDEAIIQGDEDGLATIRKRISRQIFGFIKEFINART